MFLWLTEITTDTPEFATLRFTRNAKRGNWFTFVKLIKNSLPDVVSRLQRDLYVDNSAASVDSVGEGIRSVNVSKGNTEIVRH